MPDRRDKRDMLALSAHMSGLKIEFIDGVRGSDMSRQERPDVNMQPNLINGAARLTNYDRNGKRCLIRRKEL
jgi:hypothetical protein